jgi:hypothetical protein
MHEEKKYRAEDVRVMNEWDERKMRVAGVDSTYVVVSIILIFLFGLGLCALEGSFINYDLAIGRFDFRPLGT